MKRVDQVSSLIVLLIASVYLYEALKLPLWKQTTFGSGLFPLIIGVILVVVALAMLVKATVAVDGGGDAVAVVLPARRGIRNISLALGSLAVYVFVLEIVGFVICTFLFLTGLFIAYEPGKKTQAVAIALAVTASSYILFSIVFRQPMPRGLLG